MRKSGMSPGLFFGVQCREELGRIGDDRESGEVGLGKTRLPFLHRENQKVFLATASSIQNRLISHVQRHAGRCYRL